MHKDGCCIGDAPLWKTEEQVEGEIVNLKLPSVTSEASYLYVIIKV